MYCDHQIRNRLNEWRILPSGYRQLTSTDRVQAGDVQRLNPEWHCEYPARGALIGFTPGDYRQWFRKVKHHAPVIDFPIAAQGSDQELFVQWCNEREYDPETLDPIVFEAWQAGRDRMKN